MLSPGRLHPVVAERRIPGISRPISPLTLGFRAPRTPASLDRVRGEWAALLPLAHRAGILSWNASSAGDASGVVEEILGNLGESHTAGTLVSVGVPVDTL